MWFNQFLKTHPNFELVPLDHERKDILKDGCILITPELYGSDGFFISRFRKNIVISGRIRTVWKFLFLTDVGQKTDK